jgi:hypothetical protein
MVTTSGVGSTSPGPPPHARITSTPSFAEVWSGGVRVGTTPFDVAGVASSAAPRRFVLRAPGYDDRTVAWDPGEGPEVHVDLVGKPASPAPPKPPAGAAAATRHPALGDIGDPWATK